MSFVIVSVLAFVLAFVSAMPIAGPVAVLVVTRAADGRFTEARKIGIGAALAEGTYAGLSFATFSTFFAHNPVAMPISRAFTCIVLTVIGVTCMRWKPRPPDEATAPKRNDGGFGLGFATSGLNPTIFVSWTAIATAIYSRQVVEMKPLLAIPYGLSAAAGIISWYTVLLRLMTRYHKRLPQRFIMWFIRGMGGFLIATAVWTGIGVVRSLLR